MKKKRLGDILQERGRISRQELEKAVQEQQTKAILLGELLLERRLVHKSHLVSALEEITHNKYLDCQALAVDPEVLKLIPYDLAVRYCSLPVCEENNKVVVVMAEPQDLTAIDELRFISGKEISPRLGFAREIRAAIDNWYEHPAAGDEKEEEEAEEKHLLRIEDGDVSRIEFFSNSAPRTDREAMREFQADLRKERTPAIRLVSAIIAAAIAKKASDIHIDPKAKGTVVRLRVDGMLRDLLEVPLELQASLISRVKILADLDIAERRAPQDGRFLVIAGGEKVDLRVSTLPTQYGEKAVLRLLDPKATQVSFQDLGLTQAHLDRVLDILARPQGMVLVTGPTGSGKTTTLYAALNVLRLRTVNVMTVEDPIEYVLEGINQVPVNAKTGRTFATCLRSILRQDPNVIMVGEIRDTETAEIALTASQTGHLVLSTLHTNDSIAAIARLIDLNIPAFLIASSVTGIIAQRLVRRLCTCREEVDMTPEHNAKLLAAGLSTPRNRVCVPAGCPACDNSGYKGRLGIFELLVFDEQIRTAVRAGAPPNEVSNLARGAGMKLLQEEAMSKVWAGLTSLEEVLRVVPLDSSDSLRCHKCQRVLAREFLLCPYCGADKRGSSSTAHAPASLNYVAKEEAKS